MNEIHAEVAVIGLGLIGSAATRHLALSGRSVIGIGPTEPHDWATHTGPYASHYDSGRITRRLDARREWAVLATRAIDEYSTIQAASGITFHNPAGLTFVRRDHDGIANQKDVIRQLDLPVTISKTENDDGPLHYSFPDGWTTLTEPAPAGAIDPRQMVRAQIVVAEQAGAQIVAEHASHLEERDGAWHIQTATASVTAESVILATGAYLQDLNNIELEASVRPEAVIIGRVSDAEAERLATMQSVIYLLEHPEIDDIYVCPPVRYPDGYMCIKMGGSHTAARDLRTAEAKRQWMSGSGADDQLRVMTEVFTTILPEVAFESFEMKPCLITDTSSGLPFVDRIADGLFIAAGGNGHAAKSADAVGALAASLILNDGEWTDTELDQSQFAARIGTWSRDEGSRHGN